MTVQTVNVAKDFSRFPAGRYRRHGPFSGEVFREKYLEESLKKGAKVVIEFDGTLGYGSSFLEEAFGGAIRSTKVQPQVALDLLDLRSSDPSLVEEVKSYILNGREQ